MKNTLYCLFLILIIVLALMDHDNRGVAYNPLFHKSGDDNSSNISMPCGLGGSHNHKH